MVSSTTTVKAALVVCAAALYACGSQQPSTTSQRAAQGAAGTQPKAESARSTPPPRRPAQQSNNNIRLSLHQQFARALFRECRLDVGTYESGGSAYLRCVRYGVAPRELLGNRKLTAEEVTRLVGLVREGNLFAGDHIGIDGRGSDVPFETLTITVEPETAVLVTSGNPSFTTGARQQLLDWMHAVMRELEESAK